MPRSCSSGRRSVSTPVSARTSTVLPWSMWPAVPRVSGCTSTSLVAGGATRYRATHGTGGRQQRAFAAAARRPRVLRARAPARAGALRLRAGPQPVGRRRAGDERGHDLPPAPPAAEGGARDDVLAGVRLRPAAPLLPPDGGGRRGAGGVRGRVGPVPRRRRCPADSRRKA